MTGAGGFGESTTRGAFQASPGRITGADRSAVDAPGNTVLGIAGDAGKGGDGLTGDGVTVAREALEAASLRLFASLFDTRPVPIEALALAKSAFVNGFCGDGIGGGT